MAGLAKPFYGLVAIDEQLCSRLEKLKGLLRDTTAVGMCQQTQKSFQDRLFKQVIE